MLREGGQRRPNVPCESKVRRGLFARKARDAENDSDANLKDPLEMAQENDMHAGERHT